MKKVILWDWDNTLADTIEIVLSAHKDLREKFQLPTWNRDDIKKAMNYSGRDFFKVFFPDNPDLAQQVYLKAYLKHSPNLKLKDGSVDVLTALKDRGFIHVLVSNKNHSVLISELQRFNILDLFDGVFGAGLFEKDKPAKEFADKVMEGYMDFDLIYVVGDGASDMKLACQIPTSKSILLWSDPQSDEFAGIQINISCADFKMLMDTLSIK